MATRTSTDAGDETGSSTEISDTIALELRPYELELVAGDVPIGHADESTQCSSELTLVGRYSVSQDEDGPSWSRPRAYQERFKWMNLEVRGSANSAVLNELEDLFDTYDPERRGVIYTSDDALHGWVVIPPEQFSALVAMTTLELPKPISGFLTVNRNLDEWNGEEAVDITRALFRARTAPYDYEEESRPTHKALRELKQGLADVRKRQQLAMWLLYGTLFLIWLVLVRQ